MKKDIYMKKKNLPSFYLTSTVMRRDNTDSLKSAEVVYNFDPMAFLSDNYATKVQTNHQRIYKQN